MNVAAAKWPVRGRVLQAAAGAGLAAFLALGPSPVLAAGCADILGKRVILAADAVDPNVFVWDMRTRMLDYASGVWLSTRAVLDHTMLVKPGTRGIVVSCVPGVVHPRFSMPHQDAIGLRILSGASRGRYGWSVEEDVHILR